MYDICRRAIRSQGGENMKKTMVLMLILVSLLLIAVPVMADPNENAADRAFLAQDINACRSHMQNMVATGEMTREQLNQCIQEMKAGHCMQNAESCNCI